MFNGKLHIGFFLNILEIIIGTLKLNGDFLVVKLIKIVRKNI